MIMNYEGILEFKGTEGIRQGFWNTQTGTWQMEKYIL